LLTIIYEFLLYTVVQKCAATFTAHILITPKSICMVCFIQQEAHLSQTDRATLRLIEYFAK